MKKGVRVVSVTEQLDFADDSGEMIASLLFSIAKMYRTKLIENTKRGLEAAKARGVKLGKRPGKWTVEVKPLHDGGMSVTDIAKRFNKSRQAVHNILNGKTATYPSVWQWNQGQCEALCSRNSPGNTQICRSFFYCRSATIA